MCIYIYIAWLRKSGTLLGFLIWTLLFWGSGPYIIYQSIYRPTYLSMHLTTIIFIYMYVYIYIHIYTYIYTYRYTYLCVCAHMLWRCMNMSHTHVYTYIYVCVYVYVHIYTYLYVWYIYIYIHSCRLASRLVCIFCHKYRSLSMFATHLLLSKLLFEGRIWFSRYWNLGTNDDFQYRALGSLPIMSWKDLVHHMYLGLGQNISF